MRNVIMAFLFGLTSSIANAQAVQIEKSVVCDSTRTIMTTLEEKYQEKPMWTGLDIVNDSGYVLFANEKTKTWTLLQFTPEVACILGVGKDSEQKIFGPKV